MLYVLFCVLLIFPGLFEAKDKHHHDLDDVHIDVVESIPVELDLETQIPTYQGWLALINSAQETLDLAAFYTSLTDGGQWPDSYGGANGSAVYNAIAEAGQRGVKVRMVENLPSAGMPDTDALTLAKMGLITLRSINWTAICAGGILHTKLIVVDGESFYVGSANMDWRSLSMVKELGVIVWRSSSLGSEALKIFETYWIGAAANSVPSHWPSHLSASYNQEHPYFGFYNSTLSSFYLAVSPPPFQPSSWTSDQDAIVNTISSANKSLCMEVMDYYPTTQYMPTNMYWPPIDTALRTAAYNGVSIRFLIGLWNYTNPDMLQYLNSLNTLENINVMAFLVPQMNDSAGTPPYTRVNHAKWMVSDNKVYVDTSNWSGDYFLNTGGVSMNIKSDSLRDRMQGIFERDWASPYVFALNSTQVQNLFN